MKPSPTPDAPGKAILPPDREIMLSRELSWLDFNMRVLDEAGNPALALLERLKFIAIVNGNLDEFFMVRVAGLRQQAQADNPADQAGLTAREQLAQVRRKVDVMLKKCQQHLMKEILPGLAARGVHIRAVATLPETARAELKRYFSLEILPVLTPLAVDPSHPFPVLNNGAIELAVALEVPPGALPRNGAAESAAEAAGKKHGDEATALRHAFVEVPEKLPRFIEAVTKGADRSFVLLEDLIMEHLAELFPGCRIVDALPFRVTRDMDFALDEESSDDLLHLIENTLLARRSRAPIRLEMPGKALSRPLTVWLREQFELDNEFLYFLGSPLCMKQFFELVGKAAREDLIEKPWPPLPHPELPDQENIFDAIRTRGAVLLALPFQSFDPVVRLLESAAADPAVLAIKQTLYRVSGDSPVVHALQHAAERGKQVTVIVELKARFDEGNNITWARRLEASGVHVVYGISGLKIHSKALLIVRREEGMIRRYVHLGTGNYNDKTALVYTDMGLFSCDPELCGEISLLFNIMTGYAAPQRDWRKIAAAPFDLRKRFIALIDREARLSSPKNPGVIIAKMNSLVDPEIIRHLYMAAYAGVRIELIVRGICCLRPGVGTRNIRVVSIVDRFLEHSRIFCFGNNGNMEYYMSSADWMPRNLDRRVELMFPVELPAHRRIIDEMLALQLADRARGRLLKADGHYRGCSPAREAATRSQRRSYDFFARTVKADKADLFKIFKPRTSAEAGREVFETIIKNESDDADE